MGHTYSESDLRNHEILPHFSVKEERVVPKVSVWTGGQADSFASEKRESEIIIWEFQMSLSYYYCTVQPGGLSFIAMRGSLNWKGRGRKQHHHHPRHLVTDLVQKSGGEIGGGERSDLR